VPRCSFCGDEIPAGEVAREFVAWELRRGGSHKRTFGRAWTERVACIRCSLDLAKGFTPNTPKLL
jgi:hypothetical protein